MATLVFGLLNYTSISTAESTTGWTKFDLLDPDFALEGGNAITGTFRSTLTVGYFDNGSAISGVGKHIRFWLNTTSLAYLETIANGGFELLLYDGSNTEYKVMFGSESYAGGNFNMVFDPALFTTLTTANIQRWGIRVNYHTAAKNVDNVWLDYIRYLDGYYLTGGTSGDELTLALVAARDKDDGAGTKRGYGVVSRVGDLYRCTGKLQAGNGATTSYFKMDDDVLEFEDQNVAASFYSFAGDGTGCHIDIIDSKIRSAGTTDNVRFLWDTSDVDIASCVVLTTFFTRAGLVTLASGQNYTGCTFSDCGQITHAGATMNSAVVKNYEGTADTAALIYNVAVDPDGEMDDMEFTMGTALTHAIQFGVPTAGNVTPATMTLTGIDFTGYHATDGNTSSALYFPDTGADVDWTVNLIGCTGDISFKKVRAGDTVTLVTDPKSFKFTISPSTTGYEWRIYTVTAVGSLAGAVEIDGEEVSTADNQTYSYSYTVDQPIAVQIIHLGSDYVESVTYYTLKNSNQDVTIILDPDNNN